MVRIFFNKKFQKTISKIKDNTLKNYIKKQIRKIVNNPKIGKPMRYNRKGTRELYIKPFRLSYAYIESEDKLVFLEIYHKKKQ
ncbi:MAG: type II toxin-antitoxin system RelE family toxin [Candidatus Nanoarchaeia archaeon]